VPKLAAIIGDLQCGITQKHPFAADIVPRAAALAADVRSHDGLVVFVRIQLRPTGADVSPRNAGVRAIYEMGDDYHEGTPGVALDPGLGHEAGDVVVTKSRASAFAGTDLDVILRAQGVETLVVAGVATSAMVAATVYAAWDLDYIVRVASDVCADPDPAVHDVLVNKIFPGRGVEALPSAELWR
jgi:nicotinamidase-related amidase